MLKIYVKTRNYKLREEISTFLGRFFYFHPFFSSVSVSMCKIIKKNIYPCLAYDVNICMTYAIFVELHLKKSNNSSCSTQLPKPYAIIRQSCCRSAALAGISSIIYIICCRLFFLSSLLHFFRLWKWGTFLC